MRFAHLHVHTEYSLLDGSSKINEIVKQAKDLGMESLAITDHGAMYGVVDFYKECLNQGIHPVIGCEVYVAKGSRLQKEGRGGDYNHLVLLAETQDGYQNLIKMVSKGFTEGFYYKPRIDWELLEQYHEGIIALSACLAGAVPQAILGDGYEKAKENALQYAELFGPDHFYLELQDHGIPDQKRVNQALVKMSRETGLELVCTNDVHYTYKEDAEAHDVLLCIQTGKKVTDEDRLRYEGGQYYLKSPEEMEALFPYAPQALENTAKIAERCQVEFRFHELKLPHYEVPEGYTSASYLRALCEKGLQELYPEVTPTLRERYEYEIGVIEKMGFVDYFLIVWDYINYAKSKGIIVGPGRGSAAGSVVAYALHITDIEPMRYSLVFERFLNEERVSMPDIDVDFCYRRRQEVIDYVTEKYGADCVSQIITFGTMAARLVIRDVARAMDFPYADSDKIAKMIPQDLGITIDKALEVNPELSSLYHSDEKVRKLIDTSRRLEGLPRHTSTHAASVVITEKPITEYVPLATNDGAPVTQFTMTTIEELGLLKMDFLGLRTLTVIRDCLDLIKYNYGVDMRPEQIPMDDPAVYQMISEGKTIGVFQLESAGMTSFMKELRPENAEDIIAGISLYRPGPMDFIPKYVEGKHHADAIQYVVPQLEPILQSTYGCIVYQEQVMEIVRTLAGYTMGRADLVRRAMSKKKADVMAKEREYFIYGNPEENVEGCIKRGIPEAAANQIFDEMTDFAKYAFNKAHATCYAVVAIETAWLKAHYPAEFMAALMTSVIDHPAKVASYIAALKPMGISLTSPDINEGMTGFSVSAKNQIRYGLSSIKGVGQNVVDHIVQERQENGPFRSMTDFCRRMQSTELNRKVLENLVKAGAFDSLGGTRKDYLENCYTILGAAQQWHKNNLSGQMDLFAMDDSGEGGDSAAEDPIQPSGEYDEKIRLAMEKEVLGIYLTGHPLLEYEDTWRKVITRTSADFQWDEEEGRCPVSDGEIATVGGIVVKVQQKITKKNDMMAFVTIEDLYGLIEILFFPKTYEEQRENLVEDRILFVRGRVSGEDNENAKLIALGAAPQGQESSLNAGGKGYNGVYHKMYSDVGPRISPQAARMQSEYSRMQSESAQAYGTSAGGTAQPAGENRQAADGPRELYHNLWLRFASNTDWQSRQGEILELVSRYPGPCNLYLYLENEKQRLLAPPRYKVSQSRELNAQLCRILGDKSVAWTK